MPIERSAMPSSTVAKPRTDAPWASATRDAAPAPWPYASALTTARSRVPGRRRLVTSRTFAAIAPRSISTQALAVSDVGRAQAADRIDDGAERSPGEGVPFSSLLRMGNPVGDELLLFSPRRGRSQSPRDLEDLLP